MPVETVSAGQADAVVAAHDLVIHQRRDVLVVDDLLAVGEVLEALEGVVQLVVADLVAQPSACRGRRRGRNACPAPGEDLDQPTLSGVMIS
jgi:adenine/guanine phosphoribosyltransferase-like PRPP-binding protein